MTCDQMHDECSPREFIREESEVALKPRLTAMDAAEAKRNSEGSALQDTPVCNSGIHERAPGRGGDGLGFHHAFGW